MAPLWVLELPPVLCLPGLGCSEEPGGVLTVWCSSGLPGILALSRLVAGERGRSVCASPWGEPWDDCCWVLGAGRYWGVGMGHPGGLDPPRDCLCVPVPQALGEGGGETCVDQLGLASCLPGLSTLSPELPPRALLESWGREIGGACAERPAQALPGLRLSLPVGTAALALLGSALATWPCFSPATAIRCHSISILWGAQGTAHCSISLPEDLAGSVCPHHPVAGKQHHSAWG